MKKVLLLLSLGIYYCSITASTILVFGGKNGWIGQKMVQIFRDQGHNPICATARLENRQDIINEIATVQPDYIVNAAGITGKPNVDWCEDHKAETIRTNVIGTLNLIDVAYMLNIQVTNISTGCIYEYDAQHPMWSGIGFTEEDEPNFTGSFYSRTKILLEKLMLTYPNVLNLRVKMPVSADPDKGFVGKIIHYKKLVNIPNSLCVLEDLLPVAVDMTFRGIKGNFNFVNPGALSHNQVLELYKQYVDPTHTWENFTLAEHDAILKARRANAELNAAKLLALYPNIPHIQDSLINLFKTMAANQQKTNTAQTKAAESSQMRIVLSAAITDAHFEFRKNQYITTCNQLKSLGYTNFYIVEALRRIGPTFLDEYCDNVFYSTMNDRRFRNNGINEARTLLEGTYHFNFDPEDMIVKMTGRYQLITDSFFKLIKAHPECDVFVKVNEFGDVYTLCYAMRCKYLQEMYGGMDYERMEREWINVEHEVGNYIKRKKSAGNFNVIYVDKVDVIANLFGSSTAPGTPQQINTY